MIWGNPPKFKSDPPKPSKKITPEMLAGESEDSQQMALFCWAAESVGKYPQLKWLFAIPNGGSRHIAEATKMVGTGLRGGVPDLMLPVATIYHNPLLNHTRIYHGCFIEMKTEKRRNHKNGGLDEDQVIWIEQLRQNNYCVAVCYSWEEARDILIAYLDKLL